MFIAISPHGASVAAPWRTGVGPRLATAPTPTPTPTPSAAPAGATVGEGAALVQTSAPTADAQVHVNVVKFGLISKGVNLSRLPAISTQRAGSLRTA